MPRSYTGDDTDDSTKAVDGAFLRLCDTLRRSASPAVRKCPSSAGSPILRCLLLHDREAPTKATASVTASSEKETYVLPVNGSSGSSGKPAVGVASASPLPDVLFRRGVVRKDALMQRLAKKKILAPTAVPDPQPGVHHTVTHGVPNHWSNKRLSEMTPTGWCVFREELGIELDVVNRPSATPLGSIPHHQGPSASLDPTDAAPLSYTVEMVPPIRCWEEAGLAYSIGKSVAQRYSLPTAIQAQCVPLALATIPRASASTSGPPVSDRIDVLGVAETGSGKTAAYAVPLLSHILQLCPKLLGNDELISYGPFALVIVPTRELAEQVTREVEVLLLQADNQRASGMASSERRAQLLRQWEAAEVEGLSPDEAREYSRTHNRISEVRVVKVVGGESSDTQFNVLSQGAHVVVGTIGQLQSLLEERLLSLGNTTTVVMDEVDRMLDEQQRDTLVAVLDRCPLPRQTLLFTATLTGGCAELADRYLSPRGYYTVRTPHRCASIKQTFELLSRDAYSTMTESVTRNKSRVPPSQKTQSTNGQGTSGEGIDGRRRKLHRHVHPGKFARLVTWLLYATPPIIVFANEKRTCDALHEELRFEAEHLAQMEEQYAMETLIGPAPNGLVFTEDHQKDRGGSDGQRSAQVRFENITSIALVHAELSQADRRRVVESFRRGERRVLLTTDLLARGLDVAGVTLVINYDLPWPQLSPQLEHGGKRGRTGASDLADSTSEDAAQCIRDQAASDAVVKYIHRIGRTGRAGATGTTVSFVLLPAAVIQRASQIVGRIPGNTGGSKLPPTLQRIFAPGTPESVRQREVEKQKLTQSGWHTTDEESVVALWKSPSTSPDSSDSDSRTESRRRIRRVDGGAEGAEHGSENDVAVSFRSDDLILKPLWHFLVQCASGNGHTDAASSIRSGRYAKVSVPAALALVMEDLTRHSRYGSIKN